MSPPKVIDKQIREPNPNVLFVFRNVSTKFLGPINLSLSWPLPFEFRYFLTIWFGHWVIFVLLFTKEKRLNSKSPQSTSFARSFFYWRMELTGVVIWGGGGFSHWHGIRRPICVCLLGCYFTKFGIAIGGFTSEDEGAQITLGVI